MLSIRTATLNDLSSIRQIQAACYKDELVEDELAFSSKIQQSAHTCWLGDIDGRAAAYLICLPVTTTTFPSLNAARFERCADPNMLYLHDLAVHPQYRTSGTGSQLVEHARMQARQMGFNTLSLIAVQDSSSYWQQHGFDMIDPASLGLEQKVASFGPDACLMQQVLKP